jgi:type VI secretion system Hcp family effector
MNSSNRSSGLTRRSFLRTSAGATGAALGGWRWLSLVSLERSVAPLAAPLLGGAVGAAAVGAIPALAATQGAGVNAFLEFPSPANTADGPLQVMGDSQDAQHPNTIEVLAAAIGADTGQTQQTGAAGVGAGKPEFSALSISKAIDSASAPLFSLLCEGASLPEARLYIRQPGATADYVVYRFGLVFITSIDAASKASADAIEQVQMLFGAMEVNYTPDPSGPTATADWSQLQNAPTFDVN